MANYDKFIAFLNGLEDGQEITIDDRVFALGYDRADKPRIAHKVKVIKGDTGEESFQYMQGLDLLDVNEFILYIMANISDEQEKLINNKIELNKTNND